MAAAGGRTAPAEPIAAPGWATLGMIALFAIGVAAIWAAPRPRMIDLPQHAAQIALLRDLALGRSPWASEVRVNLATPYLIGYGLALPLAFVMSAGAALKTVLTAAYAGFIVACLAIRRELGATPRLDPYYAVSFFGFAYGWGMYTFLVAAPLGLAFLWLAIRYARLGGVARGAGLAALGVALLFAHGLVFLFAAALGGTILLVRSPGLGALGRRVWPYALLGAACLGFFLMVRANEAGVTPGLRAAPFFGGWDEHLTALVAGPFDVAYSLWPKLCFPVFFALPWLGGLRAQWGSREAVVIAAGTLATVMLVPYRALDTALLFHRFALFVPPAYAWLMGEPEPRASGGMAALRRYLGPLAGAATAAVLLQQALLAAAFGREQQDFEQVLAHAQPGGRALALIFDRTSRVDGNLDSYMHHVAWYQADRGGFVDFNFAVFPPQIARFRPGRTPPVDEMIAQHPARFDWRGDGGDRYRYIFVRSAGPTPPSVFAGAARPPALISEAGEWKLYDAAAGRGE